MTASKGIPISVRQSYQGKRVFLAGATGFLGKTWLALLLEQLPEIDRIYVLIRRKGKTSGQDRFEKVLNSSPVFRPLHEKHGKDLNQILQQKLRVVEGDLSEPNLGLNNEVMTELRDSLDLLINSAGLVEFFPDLRQGTSANIEAAINAQEFAKSCQNAAYLHVSTAFVCGKKEGKISETISLDRAPNGEEINFKREYLDLKERIDEIVIAETEAAPEVEKSVRERMDRKRDSANLSTSDESRVQHLTKVLRRRRLREQMIQEGRDRAEKWGWQNAYTYTKALAEGLLTQRAGNLRMTIFRPAIIESSHSLPFPGWNEGFNTSGPLAYLLGTWFRYLPAKKGNPFDVIPVDFACRALTLSGAGLLAKKPMPIVHCGSSHLNPLSIDRACELTSLEHRRYYRKHGNSPLERMILSRWDAIPVDPDHRVSVHHVRRLAKAFREFSGFFPTEGFPVLESLRKKTLGFSEKVDRRMEQVENLLELFMPFIHDYNQVFRTDALPSYEVVEEEFRFEPQKIQWREYWLNTQMPGLRRWCFPVIDGKKAETYTPAHPVRLDGNEKKSTPRRLRSQTSPQVQEMA